MLFPPKFKVTIDLRHLFIQQYVFMNVFVFREQHKS